MHRPLLICLLVVASPTLASAQEGPGGARLEPTPTRTASVTETPDVPPSPPEAPLAAPAAPAAAPAAPEMPSMPTAPAQAPTAPPESPGEIDRAWSLYHDAFLDTVMGRQMKARRELERLRVEHPEHPATLLAARLLERMDEVDFGTVELDAHYGSRRPSGLARAELVTAQTVSGITMGGWMCGLAECEDARVWVSVLTLGGAAGLTGSLLLTDKSGVTPGRALAINTGTTWGVYNGAMLAAIADADGNGLFGALLAGQLLGTGAGVVASLLTDPTAGDVSMVTSGGLWMGGLMFLLNGIGDFELFDGDGDLTSILVMSDLGLVGAGLLRGFDVLRMSRSRALLIDVGGLMGTLLGMGLGVLVQGDNATPAGVFGPGLAGMLAGLGGTFWLTRNWDTPDIDVSMTILPATGGGLTVGLGGRF